MTLKELRESRAYSQSEVATYCEVHPQTVSVWERGLATPRPAQIRKLAELFRLGIPEIQEVIRNTEEAAKRGEV